MIHRMSSFNFDNAPKKDLNFAGKVEGSVYHPYSWESAPACVLNFDQLDIEAEDVPDNCDHECGIFPPNTTLSIGSKMSKADSLEHKGNKLLKFAEKKYKEASRRDQQILWWFGLERQYDESWSARISDFFNGGEKKKELSRKRSMLKLPNTLDNQVKKLTDVGKWLLGEAKGLK